MLKFSKCISTFVDQFSSVPHLLPSNLVLRFVTFPDTSETSEFNLDPFEKIVFEIRCFVGHSNHILLLCLCYIWQSFLWYDFFVWREVIRNVSCTIALWWWRLFPKLWFRFICFVQFQVCSRKSMVITTICMHIQFNIFLKSNLQWFRIRLFFWLLKWIR